MPVKAKPLAETHIIGTATREWKVRAQECPPLAGHHIAHVGVADAAAPYEMVRMDLSGTYLLSCSGGRGRILLDGRWQLCREGWACLAPPHALLAFRAEAGARWEFTWVRYQQPPEQKPIHHRLVAGPGALRSAAAAGGGAGAFLRNAKPDRADDGDRTGSSSSTPTSSASRARGRQMTGSGTSGNHVAARLGEPWSLDALARHSHLSAEHLRRLCRRELGRSPMHQVIYLRMQLAAKLLATTNDKIETIAKAIGYENPFVFSTTFKKWVGWRPSDYRAKRR